MTVYLQVVSSVNLLYSSSLNSKAQTMLLSSDTHLESFYSLYQDLVLSVSFLLYQLILYLRLGLAPSLTDNPLVFHPNVTSSSDSFLHTLIKLSIRISQSIYLFKLNVLSFSLFDDLDFLLLLRFSTHQSDFTF
jgi:hypothetical protein